ncbi:MAG: rhomboid family intramembrane serine protease [Thermodesulfobacteriota bacterium]|nr:rhomboid family intramembrane serine protease [Thermodesulfobacteriota bacterium]
MPDLLISLSAKEVESFGLVLASSGIGHHVKKGEKGWELWVEEKDYHRAWKAIGAFLEENEERQPSAPPLSAPHPWGFSALWACLLLLGCHVLVTTGDHTEAVMKACASSASQILRGELYRTITSLTLHGSPLHLLGNLAGIGLFGTALCSITGTGVGWLMIVTTGMVGNLVNAFLYRTGHVSIGASTAVFGAIGILAAYQFIRKFRLPRSRAKAWVPLAGGLALLGILGSGEHVDLTAHLAGFMAGIALGCLYTLLAKERLPRAYQAASVLGAIGLLAVSWMRGLISM